MPAKRLVIVSAACLRHLRSLLRTRARHVCICAVRSRLEAAVRLGAPWRAKFHILVRVQCRYIYAPHVYARSSQLIG